jgi:hypothetical protein
MSRTALVPLSRALQQIQRAVGAAEHALDQVDDLTGAINVQKGAETLRVMCAKAHADLRLQNHAAEIRLGAERKAGAMLETLLAAHGQQGRRTDRTSRHHDEKLTYGQTLEKCGLPEPTARRFRNVSKVSAEDFAKHVKAVNAQRLELTTTCAPQILHPACRSDRHEFHL